MEIDLSKKTSVASESIVCLEEAGSEVVPCDRARHVEQQRRKSIGGNLNNTPENQRKGQRRENGIDHMPKWPKKSLLVHSDKVSAHEQPQQVPMLPYLAQPPVEPAGFWPNDRIPIRVGVQVMFVWDVM